MTTGFGASHRLSMASEKLIVRGLAEEFVTMGYSQPTSTKHLAPGRLEMHKLSYNRVSGPSGINCLVKKICLTTLI